MELQALVEAGTVTSEALDAAFTHFLTPFPMLGCTATPAHHQDRLLQLLVPHRVVSQALSQYLSGFIPPADGPDGAQGSSGIDICPWVRRRDPRCLQMHSRVRITRRAEACVAAACGIDLRDVAVTVGIPGVETVVSNTVHTPTPPSRPAPASVPVAATTQLSDHQSPPFVRDATFTSEETRPFTEIQNWKQLANDVLANPVAAVSVMSGADASRDFMGMVFGKPPRHSLSMADEQTPSTALRARHSIAAAALGAVPVLDDDSGSFHLPLRSDQRRATQAPQDGGDEANDAAGGQPSTSTEPSHVHLLSVVDEAEEADRSKRSDLTKSGEYCSCEDGSGSFGADHNRPHSHGADECMASLLGEDDDEEAEACCSTFFATLKAAFAASPNVWRLFLFTAVYNIGASIVWSTSVWPPFLETVFGSNTALGWIASASGFMELTAAILSGFAADHFGRNITIRVASCILLCACVGVGVGVFLESFPAMMIGSGGAGLAYGAFFPCTEALFADSVAPCQRTVVYTCKYALEVGAGLIGVCLSLSLFLAIGNTWDIATLKIVIGTGLGVVVAAALSLFLLDSRYALPEAVMECDGELPTTEADDAPALSQVMSQCHSQSHHSRTTPNHSTPFRSGGLGFVTFAGAFSSMRESRRARRTELSGTFTSDAGSSMPQRPQSIYLMESRDNTVTSDPGPRRTPRDRTPSSGAEGRQVVHPPTGLLPVISTVPEVSSDGDDGSQEFASLKRQQLRENSTHLNNDEDDIDPALETSLPPPDGYDDSPDIMSRLPAIPIPRRADELSVLTSSGAKDKDLSLSSTHRRNSRQICPLCGKPKRPDFRNTPQGQASSGGGLSIGRSGAYFLDTSEVSPSVSITAPPAHAADSGRRHDKPASKRSSGRSRVAVSPPSSFLTMSASGASFLPVTGKANQRSMDRVATGSSPRLSPAASISDAAAMSAASDIRPVLPTVPSVLGTARPRPFDLRSDSDRDGSSSPPMHEDTPPPMPSVVLPHHAAEDHPAPAVPDQRSSGTAEGGHGGHGLQPGLLSLQHASSNVASAGASSATLPAGQWGTAPDKSNHTALPPRRVSLLADQVPVEGSLPPEPAAAASHPRSARLSQSSTGASPSGVRRRSSACSKDVAPLSRQPSMTSAPASRASIGPGRTSFLFGQSTTSVRSAAAPQNPRPSKARRTSNLSISSSQGAPKRQGSDEELLNGTRPQEVDPDSPEAVALPHFRRRGSNNTPRSGRPPADGSGNVNSANIVEISAPEDLEEEGPEDLEEEVKIDYNCEGCGLFRVPPWLAPYCLSFSNVFVSAGGGMTVLYFSLFMRDTFDASPVVLQLLNGSVTIMTVFLAEMLALADARGVNRFFLQVPPTIIGVTGSLMLATIDGGAIATLWGTFVLFTFRMSMMSCNVGLIRALVMDLVNPAQRARWNALESLASAMWAASAAGGGYIIDSAGYRKSFLITFCIHTIAVGLLVAIMRNKDPKDEDDTGSAEESPTADESVDPPSGLTESARLAASHNDGHPPQRKSPVPSQDASIASAAPIVG